MYRTDYPRRFPWYVLVIGCIVAVFAGTVALYASRLFAAVTNALAF